ncbi:MAG: tripartite tricarboxylate transporter permease [Zoogloeaceae bacterium]|jgi:TctA family transporter|nr:tripartite tricarboxylate transporter permease [Zoogloeaceae bacterium]
MEFVDNLSLGFSVALTGQNLLYAFIGCVVGTLIGVLPGLGPVATIAMLLPLTYELPPAAALIMLASIYYGAQYGGSITSILLKLPGESSTAITVIDGHAMARQGRAGPALSAAAIGSFIAGSFGVLLIAILAAPLTRLAFQFGPAEYFSLMLLGLIGSIVLSPDALGKSLATMVFGILLSMIGTDVSSGAIRFSLGLPWLVDGIEFTALVMGLFGIGEIIFNLETQKKSATPTRPEPIRNLLPTRTDIRRMVPSILRGTALGSLLGVLPGAGATMASFAGYMVEKKVSRYRSEMGEGAIEGVAAPESANNAAAQTNFIPLLTLGIPGSATMALLLGAMIIQNIQPGPQVIRQHPDIFWGLVASMWIGNLMLVILNLPLVSVWVRLLKIPYRFLFPAILVFCSIGAYSVQSSVFDIFLLAVFGVLGYLFIKLDVSPIPLLLGFVLGPLLEENFRRAMMMARGDFTVFVRQPLSLALLLLCAALLAATLWKNLRIQKGKIP